MGLLDHMVVLFLVLQRTPILFSIVAIPIYIPMNSIRSFPFSTFSPAYIVYRMFDDGHSDWCEVILIFLNLHFSNNYHREGNGTPLHYSCLENPMDGEARWAAVHGVTKSWTWLSNFTFTFHFHALEKEMATHSSVPAWRIPGTGEPVGCRLWGCTESDD